MSLNLPRAAEIRSDSFDDSLFFQSRHMFVDVLS